MQMRLDMCEQIGGIYQHTLLIGVRTAGVRMFDKYRVYCTYAHSKLQWNEFRKPFYALFDK